MCGCSTDHQQYSTENQADAIRQYAARHDMEIVKTYADEGKSGLSIDGRDALKQLLEDVQKGRADFSVILVYDISRWGQLQDADEAAHNEYLCRRAGIDVRYCAEPFENDGSFGSDIQKMLKRKMAGEYSRELSVKVFAGQCRLIEHGFRQGGPAGFGLPGGFEHGKARTFATVSSGKGALPGLRVLSLSRPSTPSSAKRCCQRHTAGRLAPTCRATSRTGRWSPEQRMIRARWTCF